MVLTAAPTQVFTTPTGHGLAGILCVVTEEPVTFANCIECSHCGRNPGCPLTVPIVERIVSGIRHPDLANQIAAMRGAQVGFSVTELLHCPRRLRLQKKNIWFEKMDGLYRMTRGTAVHDLLEGSPGGIKKTRLDWTFKFLGQKITLSGEPDLVELRPNGLFITDYKVTENPPRQQSTWTCTGCGSATSKTGDRKFACPKCGDLSRAGVYRDVTPPKARSSHARQINLYGLLIEKNIADVAAALGATGQLPIMGGEVVYLPPTLPLRIAVPYNREATMTFLKERLKALLTPGLPPVLAEDSDDHWECGFCPLAEACQRAG